MSAAGPSPTLADLISNHRVVLCVGCGGVGKTTTCAALGLAAARRGKNVLCLTIDPAKRLAQSLGLEQFKTEAQRIAPEVFDQAGVPIEGSLTVMMLDTKSTFDSLIGTLSDSDERRERVMNNVLYQYISTTLAGTQEYMAMEKLYAVKEDPAYDIILLDTPPTSHALDFLDAPDRLVGAIDSPAVRWFLQAFQKSGKLSLNLLQRSAALVLKALGKMTGAGFLDQVAVFITEMNELFGGWRARADEVSSALRGPEVGYVLVTSPEPMSIREVLFFAERLKEQQVQPDAFVVNRIHGFDAAEVTDGELEQAIAERKLSLEEGAPARIREAAQHERRHGELNRLHLYALDEVFDSGGEAPPALIKIPDFPGDIHDVSRLSWVSDVLIPAEEQAASKARSAANL